jgi:hypothetical protein
MPYFLQANDAYSAITQVDKQRAEPEKIRLWREENTRRIAKKGKRRSICIFIHFHKNTTKFGTTVINSNNINIFLSIIYTDLRK